MNCLSCGSHVPENASFCPQCGAFVAAGATGGQAQPQPQQPPGGSDAWPQPQQPGASGAWSQPQQPNAWAQPQPQPDFTSASQSRAGGPVYAQGCIAAAWKDVKDSPDWLSRTALLGIIQCVPILNFFALGYALNWSREVPFGGKSPMPAKIFSGANFEIGFYAFVITLVFSLVGSLGAGILAIVPLIGALAGAVFAAGLAAVACLCCVRMGIKQRFGAGFELGAVWNGIMRSLGAFLAAALLPVIVAGVTVAVVTAVGGFLGMGMSVPFMFIHADIAVALVGLLVIVGGLILYVASCVVVMTATLVTDRALAHWVGRFASEWIAQ